MRFSYDFEVVTFTNSVSARAFLTDYVDVVLDGQSFSPAPIALATAETGQAFSAAVKAPMPVAQGSLATGNETAGVVAVGRPLAQVEALAGTTLAVAAYLPSSTVLSALAHGPVFNVAASILPPRAESRVRIASSLLYSRMRVVVPASTDRVVVAASHYVVRLDSRKNYTIIPDIED